MNGDDSRQVASRGRISSVLLRVGAAIAAIVAAAPLQAQWKGEVSLHGQVFGPASAARGLADHEGELGFLGSYYLDWDRGRQAFSVEPFLLLDPSGERTRFDLRELNWEYRWDRRDLRVGFHEVFWGVAESTHLVDVVNQRDITVGGLGYVKMGQPLVGLATRQDWGSVELLVMPYFRERSFAGRAGALWSSLPVAADQPRFQSAARNWHVDAAIRWSHSLGTWDVGATYFRGTNRDPRFVAGQDSGGGLTLLPYYDVINQTAIDVQWTRGSWLWKLEASMLDPDPGRYVAAVGGLEYAAADYLSLFGEYAYDSRGDAATTSFNDDFYAGAQLLLQDGRVRAGAYFDRQTWNTILSIRAERRLSDVSLLSLEVGGFVGRDSLEPPYARRQHDYLSLTVSRYF